MSVAGGMPPPPDPPEDGSAGYCRACGEYGFGRYDGIRTAHTDWIKGHCKKALPDHLRDILPWLP